ncbi:hypothetical protein F2Q69_00038543 [Brassica cretica]|uniref:Zinc finger GRF-type domain-containing protein n=1 Tax=Brassica cretica TaxID=69181 RepID=A0A8S9SJC7_BRACR|nr:hypothetical protein F2Q69_00038543 [Brassica cretica]
MDSRNNYTQSSSYVRLLYSQQGSSVQHENFPYESFHSSVHLGESENPPFSSQQSEDTPVGTPVKRNMGLDYSYSQPSESEDLFCNSVDSGYSETDDLIRRDQEEISLQRGSPVQYPPKPEVEFGFPQRCYCGAQPLLATSSREIGRRYYTCVNVNDGECHVWKWWNDALMEELRARDRHVLLLSEKVDSLALLPDYET